MLFALGMWILIGASLANLVNGALVILVKVSTKQGASKDPSWGKIVYTMIFHSFMIYVAIIGLLMHWDM